MTLITRFSRLFQADMHAVLDKIEEPEMLLKQAIREMEESIAADRKQIRLWEYEQRQLIGKSNHLNETIRDLDEKLSLCFKSDKDDLARSLIKRKLETQLGQQWLDQKITADTEKIAGLAKRLEERQAQLAGMQQKADILIHDDQSEQGNWENKLVKVQDEDVEIAFLHEKQKWSQS